MTILFCIFCVRNDEFDLDGKNGQLIDELFLVNCYLRLWS